MNEISEIIKAASECSSLYGVIGILIVCVSIIICVIAITRLISKYDSFKAIKSKDGKSITLTKRK